MKFDVSLSSAFWTINFRSFGHKLTRVCQNRVWRAQSQFVRKFCDWFVVRKIIPELEGNFSAVCQRKLSVKVRTALYVLEMIILGQFLKKKLIVQVFRTNQFVAWCVELFGILLITVFLVSGEKIGGILFFPIKFFRFFWTLGQKSSAKLPEHLFRCPVEQIEKNTFLSKKVQNVFGPLA